MHLLSTLRQGTHQMLRCCNANGFQQRFQSIRRMLSTPVWQGCRWDVKSSCHIRPGASEGSASPQPSCSGCTVLLLTLAAGLSEASSALCCVMGLALPLEPLPLPLPRPLSAAALTWGGGSSSQPLLSGEGEVEDSGSQTTWSAGLRSAELLVA